MRITKRVLTRRARQLVFWLPVQGVKALFIGEDLVKIITRRLKGYLEELRLDLYLVGLYLLTIIMALAGADPERSHE